MDTERSLNPDILEEVFNEIDGLEDEDPKKSENPKKLGFLEDVVNLENEISYSGRKKKKNSQSDASKSLEEEKSVIHEGLTDSSDDEDNKYFEENKYNDCGRSLKNLLKDRVTSKPDSIKPSKPEDLWSKSKSVGEKLKAELDRVTSKPDSIKPSKPEDLWSKSKSVGEKLKAELERLSGATPSGNGLIRDPILGMNIINPLISSAGLKDKLIGRVSISTSKLKQFLETPASKDSNWVTGGAVVSKLTRTSQKGNQYCVWHVTDLSGDLKTVSVFLFGSAYKEYWKTSIGTVVGILNPIVMDGNDKSEATLRVDNAQKILVIGMSKDYGLCKSKKKNGENCLSVVNKSKCDYCVYHMKKEYNKACRRSDLQPPKIGRKLDNLRAKVLGKNQVFYGGKTFTGVVGKKSSNQLKKDQDRLKLLSQNPPPVSESQKQKDENILKRLTQNPSDILAKNKLTPTLAKPECQTIDLGFTVTKKERIAAKVNALKYIREHGPLKKLVDGDRTKRTPEQISSVKRRLEEEDEKERKKAKLPSDSPVNTLKEKQAKNGITEEFLKLMNSETRNGELLKVAETEEREKYFNKLEMREKIENKMASTFKVECKAVRCLKCNYKSFSASELCKREKHPLKVVNAIKRFWKCGDCSARTVCLELVPLHSCKTCGSSKWERASMMAERKDGNITKAPLSLRGDEEIFIGSATKQANLNLLVPEEAS